jgi:hypothetical protein
MRNMTRIRHLDGMSKMKPKSTAADRQTLFILLDPLGVTLGSVTPFALINDPEGRVSVGVDAALLTFAEVNCRSFFPSPDRCPGRCQTGIPGPSSR